MAARRPNRSSATAHGRRLGSVAQLLDSFMLRTVYAAINRVLLLDTMPDYAAAAMFADRGERMYRAFEAVVGVRAAVHRHLERFVVFVAAGFASGHLTPRCAVQRVNSGRHAQFRVLKTKGLRCLVLVDLLEIPLNELAS